MTTNLLSVFLFSVINAFFAHKVSSRSINRLGARRPNLVFFIIAIILPILYAGWRNNVGDTFYYLHTFRLIQANGATIPAFGTNGYLFELFQYLLISTGRTETTFIMLTTLMFQIPVYLTFYNYSVNFSWAMFFFMVTGTYVASLNGIRQLMATGLLLLGTHWLFSPKKIYFWPYLILVLIAAQIHSAALIMIPVYLLCRRRSWSLPFFVTIIAAFGFLLVINFVLPTFYDFLETTNYSGYTSGWFTAGEERGATFLRVLVNWIPTIMAAYYTRKLRIFGPVADLLINLSVVHSAIYALALFNWIFARFAFFTFIYNIILLAMIFTVASYDKIGRWLLLVAIPLYLVFFIKDAYAAGVFLMYNSTVFVPDNSTWFRFLA